MTTDNHCRDIMSFWINEDKLYSFIMRGELTKVSLEDSGVVSKHSSSAALTQKYIDSLSLDLLDDERGLVLLTLFTTNIEI